MPYKNKKTVRNIQKEIEIAEKIVDNYPKNDSIKKKALNLINNVKRKLKNLMSMDNVQNTYDFLQGVAAIFGTIVTILTVLTVMSDKAEALQTKSPKFTKLLKIFTLGFYQTADDIKKQQHSKNLDDID
jgi:hypothetical protein